MRELFREKLAWVPKRQSSLGGFEQRSSLVPLVPLPLLHCSTTALRHCATKACPCMVGSQNTTIFVLFWLKYLNSISVNEGFHIKPQQGQFNWPTIYLKRYHKPFYASQFHFKNPQLEFVLFLVQRRILFHGAAFKKHLVRRQMKLSEASQTFPSKAAGVTI